MLYGDDGVRPQYVIEVSTIDPPLGCFSEGDAHRPARARAAGAIDPPRVRLQSLPLSVEKRNSVVEWKVCPGFSIVDGKFG